MEKTLEFAAALGIHFVCFLVGAVFLAVAVLAVVRGVKERRGVAAVVIPVLILTPFGLIFTCGTFAAMWEHHGLEGCLIQGGVFAVLLFLIALPLVLRRRRPVQEKKEEQAAPAVDTLDSHTPQTSLFRRCVSAAAGLYLVLAYVFALAGRPWSWLDNDRLVLLAQMEFLIIHSCGMLGLLAAVRIRRLPWNVARWSVFGLLMCLYVRGALMAGLDGVWVFLYGAAATYSGVVLNPWSDAVLAQTAKRWAASFAAFCILTAVFQLPELVNNWEAGSRTFGFGLSYFGVLAVLEISPLYYRRWLKKRAT
jgi:hypothetical protein